MSISISVENINWDYDKIHQELRDTCKRQQEIRKLHYETYNWCTGGGNLGALTKEEQMACWEFLLLSSKMTRLCCLINHTRGTLHMVTYKGRPFTLDKQEKLIDKMYPHYIKGVESWGDIDKTVEPVQRLGFIPRIAAALKSYIK